MDYWEKTVTLRFDTGPETVCAVSDSRSAARVLLKAWPEQKGKSYRRAVLNCSAALHGKVPQDLAQWSFIVAAMEADIAYEIGDRFDMEIAEVCRELLGDLAPQEPVRPKKKPVIEIAGTVNSGTVNSGTITSGKVTTGVIAPAALSPTTQPFWWPKRQASGPSAR